MKLGIKMDKPDNVAVVLEDIAQGDTVKIDNTFEITAKQKINRGHKIAVSDLKEGEYIIKYGVPVGRAKYPISVGEHILIHDTKYNQEYFCNIIRNSNSIAGTFIRVATGHRF